jgi:hypothetical protein
MAGLDLDALERDTRGLVYVSDGSRPSEKLGKIVDAFPKLLAAAREAGIRDDVAWLAAWNDQHDVDPHIRMLKISEEYGEATEAYLGYLGANPRKGVTNGIADVWSELADTALAALVAIESLGGDPESELLQRIGFVRARLESHDG